MAELQKKKNIKLGLFSLIILNIAIVVNLSIITPFDDNDLSYLFFYLIAAFFFFIPVAFAVAELSAINPEKGGIYYWVKIAFGKSLGLFTVSLQWLGCSIFSIIFLTFASASFAFLIMPDIKQALSLASNEYYIIPFILVVYWSTTFLIFKGIKVIRFLFIFGVCTSVIIPLILLIILIFYYVFYGQITGFNIHHHSFIPDITKLSNLKVAASTFTFFFGLEMASNFGKNVNTPRKTYFYGTLISALIIIISFLILCTFYFVVSNSGKSSIFIIEVTRVLRMLFGSTIYSEILGKLFIFLTFVGVLGCSSAYIIGSYKGLFFGINDLNNRLWINKKNKNDIPHRALIIQAVIVSFFCLAFVLQPTPGMVCAMLGDFLVLLFFLMYLIMFPALIKIRFSVLQKQMNYKIPVGRYGIFIIYFVGFLSSAFAIFIGLYLPAKTAGKNNPLILIIFFIILLILLFLTPSIVYIKKIKLLVFGKPGQSGVGNKSIAIVLVGLGILAYIIKYVLNIILTRYLSPSDYGDLAVSLRIIIILSLLLLLGTNNSVKKYLTKYLFVKDMMRIKRFILWNLKVIYKSLVSYIIMLLILYLIILLLHVLSIRNMFSYHIALFYLPIAPLAAISVLFSSYILSNKWPVLFFFFRKIAVFIFSLILIGGGILFYNVDINLYTIGVFLLLAYGLVLISELILINKIFTEHSIFSLVDDYKKRIENRKDKVLWLVDSFRMIGTQLIFNLIWAIDLFILEIVHNSNIDVGYYAAMLVLTNILLIIPSATTTLLVPNISSMISKGRFDELQQNINLVNFINILILSLLLIILLIFSDTLLLVFGKGYNSAEVPFIILCFTYYLASIFVPGGKLLTFTKTEKQFIISITELLIVIICGIVLTLLWGLTGMALSVLVSITFKSIITFFIVRKNYPIKLLSII
ncbi:MAG: amino acid permease [bacterium]|nr:amino acid permease [bacterium]